MTTAISPPWMPELRKPLRKEDLPALAEAASKGIRAWWDDQHFVLVEDLDCLLEEPPGT